MTSLIAIVDDEFRVLESLREVLESAGHAVPSFPSPQSLLASHSLKSIDCLVTDIGLAAIADLLGFAINESDASQFWKAIMGQASRELVTLCPASPLMVAASGAGGKSKSQSSSRWALWSIDKQFALRSNLDTRGRWLAWSKTVFEQRGHSVAKR